MSDKPVAGLVTAAIVAPMVVCCLAPALVVTVFSGGAAWIGGIDPVVAVLVGLVVALAVMVTRRGRSRRSPATDPSSLEIR